jgi:hypothetical protein
LCHGIDRGLAVLSRVNRFFKQAPLFRDTRHACANANIQSFVACLDTTDRRPVAGLSHRRQANLLSRGLNDEPKSTDVLYEISGP